MNQVAEGGSLIIGDARERRDTIHADHINMVKFSDASDGGIPQSFACNQNAAGGETRLGWTKYVVIQYLVYHFLR